MKIFESLDDTGRVELSCTIFKLLLVPEDGPELSAQAGLHQHVQVPRVTEGSVQLNNEWAGTGHHDVLLVQDVLLVLLLLDLNKHPLILDNNYSMLNYNKLLSAEYYSSLLTV